MAAQLKPQTVTLLPRQAVLTLIERAARPLISIHEHLGEERLYFDDGMSISYTQDLSEFVAEVMPALDSWLRPDPFVATFFASPIYERFANLGRLLQDTGRRDGQDLYFDANVRLFEQVGAAQAERPARFLPIPFLFVDPFVSADVFRDMYAPLLPYACGLKWHPFAAARHARNYVAMGHLDLAAELRLPVLIHCERPGNAGDLASLIDTVGERADTLKVAVNLAHFGFFHEAVRRLKDFRFLFSDLCPWSALCGQAGLEGDPAEVLARVITEYEQEVLWGLDSPYNVSLWPDGKQFGGNLTDEILLFKRALANVGQGVRERVAFRNVIRFLNCDGKQ